MGHVLFIIFAIWLFGGFAIAASVGDKFALKKEIGELHGSRKAKINSGATLIDIEKPKPNTPSVYIYTFESEDGIKFNVGASDEAAALQWIEENLKK